MKTLYLIVLLCALCASAFAQTTLTLPRKTQVYYWDGEASPPAWVAAFTYTNTYNTRGQETESIQATDAINMSRALNTYENFILKESENQSWDMLTSTWKTDSKSTYTYDAQGRQSTITMQSSTSTTPLVNSDKYIYTYTGNETRPTTIVYQEWDATTNTWKDDERDTNFMWTSEATNPAGYIMYETQTYDAATNTWTNSERNNSSYNSTTRTLTLTTEDASGTTWVNREREIITYDDKMNLTGLLTQEWENNAWAFETESQYVLTYNSSNVLTERIIKIRETEDEELENAIREVMSDFQTFVITGSAEQLPESSLAVFPNPTTNNLKVALNSVEFKDAQVELFNLQGKKVYGAAIPQRSLTSGAHVIPTEHLSRGMYILHIKTDNNKEISRRVVKN
ncbi:T9SS type A sorting domain-containing protein [Rufibacter latericius]|uniref:T9SS C-terminal target domain-containing protein n=1 Tax=Rufibacter latericius TaxID=2487040 RepID=A0A3M9MDJ1_9BACT|nr:T9SS type A sorting domain-containing protein [Rufibacter latericius]RNI23632.1 T9SS C-terminal target domain-containing protein [Rufibacter latericius]